MNFACAGLKLTTLEGGRGAERKAVLAGRENAVPDSRPPRAIKLTGGKGGS